MLVKLVTVTGDEVLDAPFAIPPFVLPPEVLFWGERVFVRISDTLEVLADGRQLHTYREAMPFHCLPGVTMHAVGAPVGIPLTMQEQFNSLGREGYYLLEDAREVAGPGPFVTFLDGARLPSGAIPKRTGPGGSVILGGRGLAGFVQVWVRGAAAARWAQGDGTAEDPAVLVTVNGLKLRAGPVLSYEDVVRLAEREGRPTVTFRHVEGFPNAGELMPGQSVTATATTVFNVVHTGAA